SGAYVALFTLAFPALAADSLHVTAQVSNYSGYQVSDGAIKLTNLVTGGLNGFGTRYFAESGNLKNGFIGALEGLYMANYWGNSDKVMGLGSNFSITGRLASCFLTQSTTSIPGLGLTIASYHAQFASARMFLPNAQWITPTVFDRLGIGGSLM